MIPRSLPICDIIGAPWLFRCCYLCRNNLFNKSPLGRQKERTVLISWAVAWGGFTEKGFMSKKHLWILALTLVFVGTRITVESAFSSVAWEVPCAGVMWQKGQVLYGCLCSGRIQVSLWHLRQLANVVGVRQIAQNSTLHLCEELSTCWAQSLYLQSPVPQTVVGYRLDEHPSRSL